MSIQEWSDKIVLVDLADDPLLSDDLEALADLLGSRGDRDVVLDFADVTYLNSSNLALLLRLRKAQIDSRRRLRLCGLVKQVHEVFHVTGLQALFDFSPQVSTALAEMQMGQ